MRDVTRTLDQTAALEAQAAEVPDIVGDAADELRDLLRAGHRFNVGVVGEAQADRALDAVCDSVCPHRAGTPWREALDLAGLALVSETRLGQLLETAAIYGVNGAYISPARDPARREAELGEALEELDRVDAAIPRAAWRLETPAIDEVVLRARGRWALDHGEPIDARALAIFGGVSERRIRNMMSKTEQALEVQGGGVKAASALAWLKDRESFQPSVWREDRRFEAMMRAEPLDATQVRFVPVAAKDEMFHPGLLHDGAYDVGEGDARARVEDYDAALKMLQAMQPPVWRRPGPGGRWTPVRGQKWERVLRSELDEFDMKYGEGAR